MIHTRHTITLSRLGLMLETGNIRLVARYRLTPWFMVRRGYRKLMTHFDSVFSEGSSEFKDEVIRLKMWNKMLTLLPALHTLLASDKSEYAEELFEHYYGRKYESDEDLKLIRSEMQKISKRYKVMFRKKKTDAPAESVSFENIIQGVETILEKSHIPREIKLYQFEEYYHLALKRLNEIKLKKHGKH